MRVETIEQLCCPAPHALSPLITVAFARDGEWLLEGVLGCVVCGAEYRLNDGAVHFAELGNVAMAGVQGDSSMMGTDTDAMRVAALLGLDNPGMRVVLCGEYWRSADMLSDELGAHCIVVNAGRDSTRKRVADHITLPPDVGWPFTHGAMDGLAIDAKHVHLVEHAAHVMRVGGRVLAPSHAPVPLGFRELVRDSNCWLAQVEFTGGNLVSLRTRTGPVTGV